MREPPRLRCPQCGRRLGRSYATTCPECGYVVDRARMVHRGLRRYWRHLRISHHLDTLLLLLWAVAVILSGWVLSIIDVTPTVSLIIAALLLAVFAHLLKNVLTRRRPRRKG